MPAMQRQERHGHQELIAALTGQQASWWQKSRGGDDLPHRLSDERSLRDNGGADALRHRNARTQSRRYGIESVPGPATNEGRREAG